MSYKPFYERVNWVDKGSSLSTPLSARNLNKMDAAIEQIDNSLAEFTFEEMQGATPTKDGSSGVVPAPRSAESNKFLRGDGRWIDAGTSLSYDDSTSTLELKNGNSTISSVYIEGGGGGGGGFPPKNVTDIKVKIGNQKLKIYWSDPIDTVVDEMVIAKWKGTKLVQKAGSFPTSPKDGTVVCDNQVRDAFKTNCFEVTGLANGQTYYFALFPYSDTGATNTNEENRFSGTPQPFRKMTAIIDLSNSNPDTCVTYEDDAIAMEAGSSEWDEFFGHYPCLFKNGVEVGKLQRDNFDKFEDGSTADISSGNAGDVMIAFPRRGLTIKTVDNKVYVSMTDEPDNANFEYNAHTRGTTEKDVFYIGAYKGYVESKKLRSLKGKTITGNLTIAISRTRAQENGSGYEQSGFYQLTYRQAMFILKYKSLNSQTAVGRGLVDKGSKIDTGGTETWGMDSEVIRSTDPSYLTDGNHHMKLFGIEDFWGNMSEWIDGIFSDASYNILTANDNFNNSGSGYTNNGNSDISKGVSGYISKPQGSTKSGFVEKEGGGSGTTYFCDTGALSNSSVARFGGDYNGSSACGIFSMYISTNYMSNYYSNDIGGRLMYL